MAKIKRYTIDTSKKKNYSRKSVTQRQIEGTNNLNIQDDLEQNYPIFYKNQPIYVHNHINNFLVVGDKIQFQLNKLYNNILKDWNNDIKNLYNFIIKRETSFLKELSTMTGQNFSKNNFSENFQNFFETYILSFNDINLKKIKESIQQKPDGKKSLKVLRELAEDYENLFLYVKKISDMESVDEKTLSYLEKHLKDIKDFIKKYSKEKDKKIKFKDSDDKILKDLSKKKLNLNTIPRIIESLLGVMLNNFVQEKIEAPFKQQYIKNIASETKSGTSGDLAFVNNENIFTLSIKSKKIEQNKTRILDTFFNINDNLIKTNELKINKVFQTLKKENAINIFKYLIMNYVYLNVQDKELLQKMYDIIALSSLNEKLFGFNKTGQQNINLDELKNKFPIAITLENGAIIFMSDVLSELIETIGNANISAKDLGTIKLKKSKKYKPLSKNNAQLILKRAVLNKYPNDINYNFIKEKIKGQLEATNAMLARDIQLSIQYNLKLRLLKTKRK